MRTRTRWTLAGAIVGGAFAVFRRGTRANRMICRGLDRLGRKMRYASGKMQGMSYRLRGRHPNPDVIDNVLADRIRSSLGALERRLDVPRVHVMVDGHVVQLHGEVNSDSDIEKIMEATAAVSGVVGVESYLHVGLAKGDTRPSEGMATHPVSDALQSLIDTAIGEGVPTSSARSVVRAVLATFADRLPRDEREHVIDHLPADVVPLFTPPRRLRHIAPPRTVHELVARVAATTGEIPREHAEKITAAVLARFRTLVPEEVADVGAVLPPELRDLWWGHAAT